MKICPFCRGEIHDDAIKCMHCQSSLLPPQPGAAAAPPVPDSRQTVYIVDQDLIRFGKFTGAVLAVIIAVGVIFFGVDIKESAKDAAASAKEGEASAKDAQTLATAMRDLQQQATTTNQQIQDAMKTVAADSAQLKAQLADAQTALAEVKARQGDMTKAAKDVENGRKAVDLVQQQTQSLLSQAQSALAAIQKDAATAHSLVAGGSTQSGSIPVTELARLYNFPSGYTGRGQTIGLIEFGGGYADTDLATYFASLNIPKPQVISVPIDGSKNSPGTEADSQVTLDIEVVGTVAPEAKIVVYFAPNTPQGFPDAIAAAELDSMNKPTVISISWGGSESTWSVQSINYINQSLEAASARGITVVVASGDAGSSDGLKDGKNHVDFPASSPWVLAVGGTRITVSGDAITSEVAWNDGAVGGATGGGVSDLFPLPLWQQQAKVPPRKDGQSGRGIPDVAIDASPSSGYSILLHGRAESVGGTAAATPFWAGLIALINQALRRPVGYINPTIYTKFGPAKVFRDVTEGNNGNYSAGPGWDPVTGWGSPDGSALLRAFQETGTRH
jgi:kumamolisin